jgi:hypothetical protein
MAAGLGSRYGGLKQLDPLGPGGQIILDYSLYDAYRAGFRRVVFIIKPELTESFEAAIGKKVRAYMQVDYVYQTLDRLPAGFSSPEGRAKPLGTGHAIYCIRGQVKAPFAVINADDFYGADAFRKIFDYLSALPDGSVLPCCMVGYRVENTLTENGTVARGVCQVDENGYLTDIVERTTIARNADGVISYSPDGDTPGGVIAEGTPVSMNLWGFPAAFLDELEGLLTVFLTDVLPQNPEKAEFYLPSAVDVLIQRGQAAARVLTTDARWFGVTYQADKPVVQAALQRLTDDGVYSAADFDSRTQA